MILGGVIGMESPIAFIVVSSPLHVDNCGIHDLRQCDIRRPHGDGRHGVLPAHAETALGGVPEQVLQGRWSSVQTVCIQHYRGRASRG